jgi:FkbM family methyltransferase
MKIYSRLLRLLPVAGGLTRLAFNPITNQVFGRCLDAAPARMLNGVPIAVDVNDYHGRILYLFGTNDPKVHHVSQALLRSGDCFLDIGANYGSIGLLAADRVGPRGQVHLFEPQPHLCKALRDAISAGGRSNVSVHELALLDHDDTLELAAPSDHSGRATLVRHCDQSDWAKIRVPVKDIATYVPPLIQNRSFGAKIDVEGAEIYLMPWLLMQPSLKFLIFEAAHNQPVLWEMVRASGLTLFGLERTVFAKRLARVDALAGLMRYHDLVAVRIPEGMRVPDFIGSYALGQRLDRRARVQ